MNYFFHTQRPKIILTALFCLLMFGMVFYLAIWEKFAFLSLSINENYPAISKICRCDSASIKKKDTIELLRPFVATDSVKRNAMSSILSRRLNFLKDGADDAKTVIGWCLAVFGGTILIIISSGYLRPQNPKFRFVYLLFLPAWIFLAFTLISARNAVGLYAGRELHTGSISKADILLSNCLESYQYKYLFLCLGFLGIWLISMLLLWVYDKMEKQ